MTDIAGRWLRVSSGGQDERSQAPDVNDYIAGKSYADGPTYELHDVSAFHGEQDKYTEQVCADGRAGLLTVLVGWHVDRLDRRGPWATGEFVAKLAAAGVRVETTSEGVISDRDLNSLVKQWSAREESEHKADRVKISHKAKRARNAVTGKLPWGLETVCTIDGTVRCGNKQHDKRAQPTPAGRRYVSDMFVMARDGRSLMDIARWLDSEHVRPARGASWSPASVGQLLRNPAYAGSQAAEDGTTVYTLAEDDRLVSWELFQAAGAELTRRLRRPATGGKPSADPALMTGRTLRCPRCTGPMYRVMVGGKIRTAYYRCTADPRTGAKRTSTCRNMIECAKLDSAVWSMLLVSRQPVMESRWVAGDDTAAALAGVDAAMREVSAQLVARKLDVVSATTRLAELEAERQELDTRVPSPGHHEQVATGRVFGDVVRELWHDGNPDRAGLRELLNGRAVVYADSASFPVGLRMTGAGDLFGLADGQTIEFAAAALDVAA